MIQMKTNVYITLERLLEVSIDKFHVDIILSNFHRNILNSLENADKHINLARYKHSADSHKDIQAFKQINHRLLYF